MCGICGLAARDPRAAPLPAPRLQAMCDVITHRGPDDEGQLTLPGIALGMRRLSILDLETGAQPIGNEDETVATVFNGELYNFEQLRAELVGRHRFRTRGDTEAIVHLYEEHGPRFAERLRGMYAIAVWDHARRRLILTRDRMGVKPLYLAETAEGLAFASEVKCLLAGGLVRAELDPVAAELFLAFGYVPGPRTLFAGVRKLAPATTLVWQDGAVVDERRYWHPSLAPQQGGRRSWREDEEELLELLRGAVRGQMVSDVPLGVMLSGGLDSSLITALMTEASAEPVKTFSIGFTGQRGGTELADARHVATRLGTDHHEMLTEAQEQPAMLEDLLWHIEEPVADLSPFGFLMLSQLARESVKVALSGQGADEILGGYRKHQIAYGAELVRRLPRPLRALAQSAATLGTGSTGERGIRALMTDDPAERLLAMSRIVRPADRASLLDPEFSVPGAEAEIRGAVSRNVPAEHVSVLSQVLYLDTRLTLADELFLYFDKMSMATSLEVRVPFADHDLVDFCLSLPDRRRIWLLRRKELLRRASRGLVSAHVLHKRKRGFFRGAEATWLTVHREFVRDVLLDERGRSRHQLRGDAVSELVDRAGADGIKADQRLLCALLLEVWQRVFVDADGAAARHLSADQPQAVGVS